jgi:hypothetical protein
VKLAWGSTRLLAGVGAGVWVAGVVEMLATAQYELLFVAG